MNLDLDRHLRDAIGDLLDTAPAPPDQPADVVAAAPSRRRPVLVAAGVLAIAGAGGLAIAAHRDAAPRSPATPVDQPQHTARPTRTVPESGLVYRPGAPVTPPELVEPDADWYRTEAAGIEAAIGTCMRAAGFAYSPRPADPIDPARPIKDEQHRRTYGYGYGPSQPVDAAGWSTFEQQLDDPAWKQAWIGGPDEQAGGCEGEALHQLYPPHGYRVAPENDELNDAAVDFDVTVAVDPQIVAAERDWSACMQAGGDTADDGEPWQRPDQLEVAVLLKRPDAGSDPGQPPSPDEIDIALDDWACQQQTDFVDRWYGRQQQLLAEFATANRAVIDSIRRWQQDVIARAEDATAAELAAEGAAARR